MNTIIDGFTMNHKSSPSVGTLPPRAPPLTGSQSWCGWKMLVRFTIPPSLQQPVTLRSQIFARRCVNVNRGCPPSGKCACGCGVFGQRSIQVTFLPQAILRICNSINIQYQAAAVPSECFFLFKEKHVFEFRWFETLVQG